MHVLRAETGVTGAAAVLLQGVKGAAAVIHFEAAAFVCALPALVFRIIIGGEGVLPAADFVADGTCVGQVRTRRGCDRLCAAGLRFADFARGADGEAARVGRLRNIGLRGKGKKQANAADTFFIIFESGSGAAGKRFRRPRYGRPSEKPAAQVGLFNGSSRG